MQSIIQELQALETDVLAISVDTPEDSHKLAARLDLGFSLLSDPQAQVIDQYGLRHEKGGPYGDVARPAVFLIDRQGRIVWKDFTDNWRVRVRPRQVLDQLKAAP